MKTLFLDLASHSQLLAVTNAVATVALRTLGTGHREEDLMNVIESMLKEAEMTLKDINRIAAVTGPGGFMSLRVGIALANALSNALGVPLAGLHLSDLWSARTTHYPLPTTHFLWVHSTKQNLLFVRGLGKGAEQWKEPTLEKIEDLKAMLTSETSFIGELIESQQKELPTLRRKEDTSPIADILPKLLDALAYEKKQLFPWYGRGA